MRNYISVNTKYYKAAEITRIYEHNERIKKPDYLLNKEHIKYKNMNKTYSNDFDSNLVETFEKSMKKKEEVRRSNKPLNGRENELLEMIISLSEEKARYYLENMENGEKALFKAAQKIMENIHVKYGLTMMHLSGHFDEGFVDPKTKEVKRNIHFHATFHNFDFKKKRTVLRNLKKQDFRDMQDLAAESFQAAGLDFVRGESKELTGKSHLERNDFILSKQKDEMQNLESELKSTRKELSNNINALNSAKNEIKGLRANFNKKSEEYKELTEKLREARENEQKEREKRRKLDEQIKQLLLTIKQHQNTINSQEKRLDEILDIDENNIKEELEKEMIEKFGKEIEEQKDINEKNKQIYIKNLNLQNEKIKTLEKSNRELLEMNHKLIENIKGKEQDLGLK